MESDNKCIPTCDCCIFSMRERIPHEGKMINGKPIGCFKQPDAEHHEIAMNCGCCKDFHCKNC